MPWKNAHWLIEKFKANPEWISTGAHSGNGTSTCPLEIKILGVLYWIGEGCSWRNIYNVSGRVLSAESFRLFSIEFFASVTSYLAPTHIRMPKTLDDLQKLEAPFKKLGIPGAVGSMDGVQIAWEACPFAWRHMCTGKEHYPTVGFNVVATHDMMIQHITPCIAGRFNDQTKIKYDKFVQQLREGKYDLEVIVCHNYFV